MTNPNTQPEDWNSPEQLAVREAGLAELPKPEVDPEDRKQLPAGGGRFAVPPHLGFTSLTGMSWRAHHHAVDEALRHSRSNADAMLKDGLILTALEERLRAASQLAWHIEPLDETDNRQVKAAVKNTLAISKTFKLQEVLYQLNWAKWSGKHGLELVYEWDKYQPDLMRCRDWTPINGDSLVPRWASKEWGRLVNSQYDGPTEPYSLGRAHFYSPEEMEAILVHSYHAVQPDYYDGLSSGALKGRGLRHGTYWLWYLRSNVIALLMDYTERLSSGVWKGYYDESNNEARVDLEQAVAQYKARSLLSLPRNKVTGVAANDLEIMEVGGASAAVMKDTISYLDGLIRSYILGRPALSGSVGGDEVALQEGAISATTKADAVCLAEDLTANWLPTLYAYNSPGCPPGRFVFDVDHPAADRLLSYAVTMRELGWSVDLDHLAKICGLPKGGLDGTISTKIQALNPVAVQAPPQSVPVAGNSLPAQSPVTSVGSVAQDPASVSSGVPVQ